MIESTQMISFYQLVDPRDNLPFYVGQTADLARRFKDYRDRSYQCGRGLQRRLRELENQGLMLIMQELEQKVCTKSEADQREIDWIVTLRGQGVHLLNKQNGQQGRERLTLYLPPDQSDWIRVQAAKRRKEISEIVEEAIRALRQQTGN